MTLDLDGSGKADICTGIRLFDHLLEQLVRHGRLDVTVAATGDDAHHLVEDVAIVLGQCLNQALGEKRGITRMGDASVPMDDALSSVAIDLSGRGYCVLDLDFEGNDLFGLATDLIRHFLETLSAEGKFNLHGCVAYGSNDHHKAESLFKALGRALDKAVRIDPRNDGQIPSTKEQL